MHKLPTYWLSFMCNCVWAYEGGRNATSLYCVFLLTLITNSSVLPLDLPLPWAPHLEHPTLPPFGHASALVRESVGPSQQPSTTQNSLLDGPKPPLRISSRGSFLWELHQMSKGSRIHIWPSMSLWRYIVDISFKCLDMTCGPLLQLAFAVEQTTPNFRGMKQEWFSISHDSMFWWGFLCWYCLGPLIIAAFT